MTHAVAVLAVVLALVLGSMPVYALRTPVHARASTGETEDAPFLRRWFYWFLHPPVRLALALGLGPLFFNLLGVAFGGAAAVLLTAGRTGSAGWAILLSGVCDALDGQVARARRMAGPRGAFLDSTLDRFSEWAVFVGLALSPVLPPGGRVLAAVACGGSLLVSYARARGESVGVRCPHGLLQRTERILLLGLGAVVDPVLSEVLGGPDGTVLLAVLVVVAAGAVGTAVFRTAWIARRLPLVDPR